jgi:hypothetical protein
MTIYLDEARHWQVKEHLQPFQKYFRNAEDYFRSEYAVLAAPFVLLSVR